MRVLVACECSGTVRDAFRANGHDAISCDLKPCERGDLWHIQGDAINAIRSQHWDLVIAHPECRYLCSSGLHWNKRRPERAAKTEAAFAFVMEMVDALNAHAARWCIENSIGCLSTRWRKPDQIIQPYNFGHDASKATALWLHSLPRLEPTAFVEPEWACCGERLAPGVGKYECANCCGEKRPRQVWSNQTASGQNRLGPSASRSADRARTYAGIAEAMAYQWGRRMCSTSKAGK